MLLFGTSMYSYHMNLNPEEEIYNLNFEAGYCTFVKQWEMARFTIGKNVIFLKNFVGQNKSKGVHISPNYAGYNPFLGLLRKIHVLINKISKNLVFRFLTDM